MAQKFNPATGEWEDDTTTSTDFGSGSSGDPSATASGSGGISFAAPAGTTPWANAPSTVSNGVGYNASGAPLTTSGYGTINTGAGAVAQGPLGTAPVAAPSVREDLPLSSTQFYNGVTGASATYDPNTGMYIDSNGQSIRPDAIRTGSPNAAPASSTPAPSTASAPSSAFNDQIRNIILSQLASASTPVDENSPQIAATLSAARDEAQRSADQERNTLAERLYAQGDTGGLSSNALTQEVQQSAERNGTALAGLRANVLMNAYNQKQQQLQALLQLAVTSGDTQSAQQIQLEIANLQAAVQREGLGVNLAEFTGQLNQNAALAGLNG